MKNANLLASTGLDCCDSIYNIIHTCKSCRNNYWHTLAADVLKEWHVFNIHRSNLDKWYVKLIYKQIYASLIKWCRCEINIKLITILLKLKMLLSCKCISLYDWFKSVVCSVSIIVSEEEIVLVIFLRKYVTLCERLKLDAVCATLLCSLNHCLGKLHITIVISSKLCDNVRLFTACYHVLIIKSHRNPP